MILIYNINPTWLDYLVNFIETKNQHWPNLMFGFYDWIKLTNITYIVQKSKSLKLIYIAYSPLLIRKLQFEFRFFHYYKY